MIIQQTDQRVEDGCIYCEKDLSDGYNKDILGYYYCEDCYWDNPDPGEFKRGMEE